MTKTLKMALAALSGLAFLTTAAAAQQRPYSPRLSCGAAKQIVLRSGAVVMGTGPDLYDRYVSNAGQCGTFEDAITAFVPTGDNPQCFVGYQCRMHVQNVD